MLAALVATSLIVRPADAARIAHDFLVRMGLSDPGRVEGISERRTMTPGREGEKVWDIAFRSDTLGLVTVYVDHGGIVFYAFRPAVQVKMLLDQRTRRRIAASLMARVPDAVPVKMDTMYPTQFYALVDGRRYFNSHPAYGYRIDFASDGRLVLFERNDLLPAPTARKPMISATAARNRLTALWKGTSPIPWPHPRWVVPVLGYYHRHNESYARLVWSGVVMTSDYGHEAEMERIPAFVDAVDGTSFKANE